MPEGLRRPILPGGRARGGIGNCRWVRRATPIPTEPAMGSELEPNAQLSENREQGVSLGRRATSFILPSTPVSRTKHQSSLSKDSLTTSLYPTFLYPLDPRWIWETLRGFLAVPSKQFSKHHFSREKCVVWCEKGPPRAFCV